MALTGKLFNSCNGILVAACSSVEIFLELLDFLRSSFFSIKKQVNHLKRRPISQFYNGLIDIKKSFLRIDIGCGAVANRKTAHAGFKLITCDLKQYFIGHINHSLTNGRQDPSLPAILFR